MHGGAHSPYQAFTLGGAAMVLSAVLVRYGVVSSVAVLFDAVAAGPDQQYRVIQKCSCRIPGSKVVMHQQSVAMYSAPSEHRSFVTSASLGFSAP